MPEALTLVVVGVSLFVTTNIDDLVILVAFFAAPAFRPRQVVIGQLLGMAALIAASAVGALAALVAPERYLGLLGVVPLGLGVAKLIASIRGRGQEEDDVVAAPGAATGALAVAGVTIANGADNLAVYIPVFAAHTPAAVLLLALLFLLLTGVWCLLAHTLVTHPRAGAPLRRYAGRALPFVLIGLGLYILVKADSHRLLLDLTAR